MNYYLMIDLLSFLGFVIVFLGMLGIVLFLIWAIFIKALYHGNFRRIIFRAILSREIKTLDDKDYQDLLSQIDIARFEHNRRKANV